MPDDQNTLTFADGPLHFVASRLTTPETDKSAKDIHIDDRPIEISRITQLDDGSRNDGSGKAGPKNGILVDGTYIFRITKTLLGEPPHDDPALQWQVTYVSPETSANKRITRLCHAGRGHIELSLNLEKEFGDDNYDMCGCEITVEAWIGDPAFRAASLPQFVHNRFRWFDGKKFADQVKQRVSEPWRIDQGQSGLCGMAALYYVMILRDATAYEKLAIELHRTGVYQTKYTNPTNPGDVTGYKIKPYRSMYTVNPNDNTSYKDMQMWDADWMYWRPPAAAKATWGTPASILRMMIPAGVGGIIWSMSVKALFQEW